MYINMAVDRRIPTTCSVYIYRHMTPPYFGHQVGPNIWYRPSSVSLICLLTSGRVYSCLMYSMLVLKNATDAFCQICKSSPMKRYHRVRNKV